MVNLDKTLPRVVIIVNAGSERVKVSEEGSGGHEERGEVTCSVEDLVRWRVSAVFISPTWLSLPSQAAQCAALSPLHHTPLQTLPVRPHFLQILSSPKFYGVTTTLPPIEKRPTPSPPRLILSSLSSVFFILSSISSANTQS